MRRPDKPLDDAERGVWERAWQRVYKRAVRAGGAAEGARAEAKASAWAAVERLRAGGGEEDHGRRRVPPEERGARARERQDATVAIQIDAALFARVLDRAEVVGLTPREWAEEALRIRLGRRMSPARADRRQHMLDAIAATDGTTRAVAERLGLAYKTVRDYALKHSLPIVDAPKGHQPRADYAKLLRETQSVARTAEAAGVTYQSVHAWIKNHRIELAPELVAIVRPRRGRVRELA